MLISVPTFPEECKIPKLIPIFKKGERADPEDYRPILLLPLVPNIIEKSIHFQIKGLNQKKQSTDISQASQQVLSSSVGRLYFVLTGMDTQMYTSVILVDLRKTFDTLDH